MLCSHFIAAFKLVPKTPPQCLRRIIMTDEQNRLVESVDDFFLRSGLTLQDQIECYHFIKLHFPQRPISRVSCQGYCSFTVFVGDDLVIQFRPEKYRLNMDVTTSARYTYGAFAPATSFIGTITSSGLLVYCMDRIGGISLKDFRCHSTQEEQSFELLAILCRDFATFLAKGWHRAATHPIPLGTVGDSMASRLKSLNEDLPLRFRAASWDILQNLSLIEALPWVLSHGDIMTGNIMLEPSTGHLVGLVDWAEAECLPFGIILYGLEEFLGEMTITGFQYHPDASDLQIIFWKQLMEEIPELQEPRVLEAVKLARDLGVLLWHGIAFDNGAINRVVEEGKDVDEIYRLDAFLDIGQSHPVEKPTEICCRSGIAMETCITTAGDIRSRVLST